MDVVTSLLEKTGYQFADASLLLEALTHRSFVNEARGTIPKDNERLEFLGDAALGLIVAEALFARYPSMNEGDLSKLRASLVNEAGCARVARAIGLGEILRLGKGERKTGGQEKPSLLANAWEALVGAVLLDGGFSAARTLVLRFFLPLLDERATVSDDAKTTLQEVLQQTTGEPPEYAVTRTEGPLHDPVFVVSVRSGGIVLGEGAGKNKKEAEQAAARAALVRLKGNETCGPTC